MIDEEGYRQNVGIILTNEDGKVLWARRIGQDAWQFPQGGILKTESPEEALYRELWEEVGLDDRHVDILAYTNDWLRYQLPKHLIRYGSKPLCIGQKQIWFLLRLKTSEENIRLNHTDTPEFDGWRWVDFWHPLTEVVSFKRDVYQMALEEFAPLLGIEQDKNIAQRN